MVTTVNDRVSQSENDEGKINCGNYLIYENDIMNNNTMIRETMLLKFDIQ